MKQVFFIVLFSCFLMPAYSQQDSLTLTQDSIARAKAAHEKTYSGPRKASIMSAILPGLGQAYNKKYWKIPIVYAGIGGFGYMFVNNNNQYNYYRKNLRAANGLVPGAVNETHYSSDQLQVLKLSYRKKRDFAIIGLALIYILNIVDANVDAHLKTFDVSDDLSLHIEPWQTLYNSGQGFKAASGISLTLNFK